MIIWRWVTKNTCFNSLRLMTLFRVKGSGMGNVFFFFFFFVVVVFFFVFSN